jgi:hypothetical protein
VTEEYHKDFRMVGVPEENGTRHPRNTSERSYYLTHLSRYILAAKPPYNAIPLNTCLIPFETVAFG